MADTSKQAIILAKLAAGQALTVRWLDALPGDLREIALRVLQVGSDPGERKARLYAELAASGRAELAQEVDKADPAADPDVIRGAGYEFWGMADALKPLPPLRWAVKGLFARPSLNIVFGAPKGMKTLLMLDAAICVAAAKRWLTAPDGSGGFAVETCPVGWLDLENGSRRMAERVSAFGRARGLSEACPFYGYQTLARGLTPGTRSGLEC